MRFDNRYGLIFLMPFLCFTLEKNALAAGESNPAALGMGGAYTALARNIDAPSWNPANLGLSDQSNFSIGIINMGIGIKNNSFTIADYNRYNGKTLTDEDKEDILNSIPEGGLEFNMSGEAAALNFSAGNLAVTYKAYGISGGAMDKDPIRLFFYGNAVVRDVSVTDSRGIAFAVGDFAISYGRAVSNWRGGELTVGGSLHYLQGLAYEKVIEAVGGVITTDSGFIGSGVLRLNTSSGGSGYALDLGTALRFKENWYFSASWHNIVSNLNWSSGNEEILYSYQMQPITAEIIANGNQDSLVSTSDTTYSIDDFSSDLPGIFKLGIARKLSQLTWAFDIEQNFSDIPGYGVNPRLSTGVEYSPIAILPIRTGMALGGGQGSLYAIGFGIHVGAFNFDFGMAGIGSPIPSSSKGVKYACGMGLHF